MQARLRLPAGRARDDDDDDCQAQRSQRVALTADPSRRALGRVGDPPALVGWSITV